MAESSQGKSIHPLPGARERLLSVAGELFAKHGRDGLSVRQITAAASVNLAAVNYHFGSKDGLFYEVCLEQVRAMNRARLELLGQVVAAAEPGVPTVEQVLDTYVRPMTQLLESADQTGLLMTRIIMNELKDAGTPFARLMRDEVQPFISYFSSALRRSLQADAEMGAAMEKLGGNALEAIAWAVLFNTGLMLHTTMCVDKVTLFFPDVKTVLSAEEILQRMVAYCAAGLRALVAHAAK